MDTFENICYSILPTSKMEEWYAKWMSFSSSLLRKHKVDEDIIKLYNRIPMKRAISGVIQVIIATFLTIFVVKWAFWVVEPRIFLSAPLVIEQKTSMHPVVVTIATNGHSAKDLVESVRTEGDFSGDIYIIGDSCTDMQTSGSVYFIQVEELGEGMLYKDPVARTSKQLKEKVYILIDEFHSKHPETKFKPVKEILYLDSDVDVNAPIAPFIASVGPEWDSNCNAYMFRERWYTRSAFSTVILLLDRDKSKNFLYEWGKVIVNHPEFPRDHLALSLFLARDGQLVPNENKELKQLNEICELPLKGGMSYGSDLITTLRGSHATTFTHSSGHEKVDSCDGEEEST